MTRWTRNGQPVGQPQRPWRLTRAQRVEMEAALAGLRRDVTPIAFGRRASGVSSAAVARAARALGDPHVVGILTMWQVQMRATSEWMVARARVAIALRAALRADEDARCEEAIVRALAQAKEDGDFWAEPGIYDGARACYEWPWAGRPTKWPLALWEIEERRRRETVRVLEALLVWGLS